MAKVKIPRRVGGVKIPKKVRRKAKKALKIAESPAVREFAAAALGAASQAKARRVAACAAPDFDADRFAETVRAAALDGLRRFLEGFEEGLRESARDGSDEAGPSAPSPGAAG